MELLPAGVGEIDALVMIAASFFTSFLSAAMGIGGGVALLAVMAQAMPALAVVPVHGVIQFGSNAGRAFLFRKNAAFPIVGYFLAGAIIGGLIGGQLVVALPAAILQLILALFILFSIWGPMPKLKEGSKGMGLVSGGGAVSTLLTMFVGATGPFVAVVIKQFGLGREAHVGTFSACMVTQHGVKIIAFGILGFAFADYLSLMAAMLVTGFAGTWVGRHFLQKTTDERFGKGLNIILTILATRLLYVAVRDLL